MNHIKTFDEAVNEGLISKVKEWLFPKVYRINYKVTHYKNKKKEKDEKYSTIDRLFDVKAKSEAEAEKKFWAEVNKQTKKLDPAPKVEIVSIYETKTVQHKHVKIVPEKK